MEATRDLMERNSERWRDAVARMDPARGADWPAIVKLQMQLAMDMTRSSMQDATRVYGEYVRAVHEQGHDIVRLPGRAGAWCVSLRRRAAPELARRRGGGTPHDRSGVAGIRPGGRQCAGRAGRGAAPPEHSKGLMPRAMERTPATGAPVAGRFAGRALVRRKVDLACALHNARW
jgi:hypothetical protein